jgi:multicomponent Na+:H+ antiporter subunit C
MIDASLIPLTLAVGALFAAAIYPRLRRSLVKLIVGLVLLGHAANLLIFTVNRPQRDAAPLVPPGESALAPGYADPIPQALILTAIVIGFGVQAFAIVLLKRAHQAVGSDDLDDFRRTEELAS